MADASRLIGTWKMVSWKRETVETGEVSDPVGPNPNGYISYAADGRMFAVVVSSTRDRPASVPPTDNEKVELFDTMLAYAGTYTFDDRKVVHDLDVSWNESWTGTKQVRFCALVGEQLSLVTDQIKDPATGQDVIHRTEFRKVQKSETRTPSDRAARFREGLAKANAEYQKITSAIFTLSVGLVALPLLFFKDVFKESFTQGHSVFSFLSKQRGFVVVFGASAYLALALSIIFSWLYVYNSGILLKKSQFKRNPKAYFYKKGKGSHYIDKMQLYFKTSAVTFAIGLILMIVFLLLYTKISAELQKGS
jgi:hypothetical protein